MAVLTAIALGTVIAGTAVKSVAAHKAAKEQQRALGEQAANADYNAQQATEQAYDASRRGVESQNVFRREVRGKLGTQQAGYGAQGVDVSMGSPRAMGASGEQLLQSDLDRISRNAEREALGYKTEAYNYKAEGAAARAGSKYAKTAGKYAVAGTILGGATDATLLASRMDWGSKKTTTKT